MKCCIFIFLLTLISRGKPECTILLINEAKNAGFHRLLKFIVTIDDQEGQTEITLHYSVSSDIYVDSNEINSIQKTHQYKASMQFQVKFSSLIDTEQPAHHSPNHSLLIHTSLHKGRAAVELPIHLRYRIPAKDCYQTILIPKPVLISPALHCHSLPQTPVTTSVPCGVTSHTPLVVLLTILTTLISTVILTVFILRE